jgi:hypothetical protein
VQKKNQLGDYYSIRVWDDGTLRWRGGDEFEKRLEGGIDKACELIGCKE